MSRWFRHYAGLARDEKLVRAAIKSGQPVERVIWVWVAILESAAEINDNGRYDFDADEAAYFLRADADELRRIESALSDLGRIDANAVARWGERQFVSDSSTERVKRFRERKNVQRDVSNDETKRCETGLKRFSNAPETETDTDCSDVSNETSGVATPPPEPVPLPTETPDARLYRRGKEVLGKSAGGMIRKLIAAKGGSIPQAHAAIETASEKADPAEYIGAIIHSRNRPRSADELRIAGEAW